MLGLKGFSRRLKNKISKIFNPHGERNATKDSVLHASATSTSGRHPTITFEPFIEKGPLISAYANYTPKVTFSYLAGHASFQTGYFGVEDTATVSGMLNLRFPDNDPCLAKSIVISLIGEERIRWTEKTPDVETPTKSTSRKRSESTNRMASNVFCNQSICVWQTCLVGYEEIRSLDIPFSFNLPTDLPASLYLDDVQARIKEVEVGLWLTKYAEEPAVLDDDRSAQSWSVAEPNSEIPIRWSSWNDAAAIQRGLGWEITLNKTLFGPDNHIMVSVKLLFMDPRVKVESISFGLQEIRTCHIDDDQIVNKSKKYIRHERVRGEDIAILPGPDKEGFVVFVTPTDGVTFDVNTMYITVKHKVKIRIDFSQYAAIEKDIVIRNFISRNEIALRSAALESERKGLKIEEWRMSRISQSKRMQDKTFRESKRYSMNGAGVGGSGVVRMVSGNATFAVQDENYDALEHRQELEERLVSMQDELQQDYLDDREEELDNVQAEGSTSARYGYALNNGHVKLDSDDENARQRYYESRGWI
ncbi:5721_t:CDS:2 [Paraglomus brasilianum]|uniref:5721_t:CDS:1 n=1 Tax=Paraglomus brasilianum TaxID=144538 RepID=A0A9N9G5R6_9GLOM|nr:5721_t:CDS:2 [Paraglomus brasilianum]